MPANTGVFSILNNIANAYAPSNLQIVFSITFNKFLEVFNSSSKI